jgi:hypothetical protein
LYRPEELRLDDEMLVLAGAAELSSVRWRAGRAYGSLECIKNATDAFDITVAWGDILILLETTTWASAAGTVAVSAQVRWVVDGGRCGI